MFKDQSVKKRIMSMDRRSLDGDNVINRKVGRVRYNHLRWDAVKQSRKKMLQQDNIWE